MGKPRAVLRDIDRMAIQTVMFQAGILPMEKTDLDMRRALSQLPPDEARKLKRKFRKMWRQAMKQTPRKDKSGAVHEATKRNLGVGKHVPSRAERNARKKLVFDQLWSTIIEPMINNFENPQAAKENAGAAGNQNPRRKKKAEAKQA